MNRNKYGAVKVELDGYKFDSKKEARRYQELKLLQKAGEIGRVEVHTPWPLEVNGQLICKYVGDFAYAKGKELIVEDTKGIRTPVYRLKKKLMKAVYGIDIVEI